MRYKQHKKTCKNLNYDELLLILASIVADCVSISAFASLVGFHIGIRNSSAMIKNCIITAGN